MGQVVTFDRKHSQAEIIQGFILGWVVQLGIQFDKQYTQQNAAL